MKFEVFCGKCKKHVFNLNLETEHSLINESAFEDVGYGVMENGSPMVCRACDENFAKFSTKIDQPGKIFLD